MTACSAWMILASSSSYHTSSHVSLSHTLILPLVLGILLSTSQVISLRTNLLLNGDVSPAESPLPYWFNTDFTVTYSMIPTNDQLWDPESVRRYIRLYTPRNKRDMNRFDAIFHVESDFSVFTPKALQLFREATFTEGKPSFCSPPFDAPYTYSWVNSFMLDMCPHDLSIEKNLENIQIQDSWSVVILTDRDLPPVLTMFKGFGLEKATGSGHIALYPKLGATVWATMKNAFDPAGRENPPFMLSWRWGKGLVWAVAQDYDRDWWGVQSGLFGWDPRKNPVSPDIVLNMIYYSVGRQLPEDITIIHEIRMVYRSLSDDRELLLSILEFVQRFGAATSKIEARIDEIRSLEKEAELQFEEGMYDESLAALREASAGYGEIGNDALKLKNQAIFWVYVIEWSVVLSSCMICGSVLYTLMIGKRLYKQAATTRAR